MARSANSASSHLELCNGIAQKLIHTSSPSPSQVKNLERRKSVQIQNPRIYQFFMNFIPLKYTSFEIPPAIFQLDFISLLISILLAMLTLKCDSKRCQKPGGGLPNKGRYGCAASAKPRPGKISPKNLMPGQKSAQKPNDRASFHEL